MKKQAAVQGAVQQGKSAVVQKTVLPLINVI